ncbi:MAG: protein-methionine-sulfoxide reductase heme-binding subunit MsrQ, partial [Paracoccaceae bacterium]|nr:protein-methionine-sulfoxide reductase heme-binding subunit MsrQ [Paracoccaceae bacterium]
MVRSINQILRKVPTWAVYLVGALPIPWFFYLALTGGLGVEPVSALEHKLGTTGLQFFVAVLAITPLRKHLGVNLLKFRRALGLLTFLYITVHLAVWLFIDIQLWDRIWADILKRPYITIGMLSFLMLIPLAVTSNNYSVRKIGSAGWRKLHWLTYPAIALGAIHNVMVQKVWETQPLVYLIVILGLLAMRFPVNRLREILNRP